MKIRTKVLGCFAFLFVLFVLLTLHNYVQAMRATKQLVHINELYLPLAEKIVEIRSNVQNLSEDLRRFYFRSDKDSGRSNFSLIARDLYPYLIQKQFDEAEALVQRASNVAEARFQKGLKEKRLELTALLKSKKASEFEKIYENLDTGLVRLGKDVDKSVREITLHAESEGSANVIRTLVLSLMVFAFGIFILLFSSRALNPLPALIQSIKKIADGDFNQTLKVKAHDRNEISLLAREYNRMLNGLKERDLKIKRQQNELLKTERLAAVGKLSAEVVHEIRNPLNALSLNIDWLEGEIKDSNEEIYRALKGMLHEVERLNQITESYLVRARVPSQKNPQTEVNSLISEVVDFMQQETKEGKIQVKTNLTDEGIRVSGDRSRLKQVFLNILKNAKESMPNGGNIDVQTTVANNTAEVRVADTGHGMNISTQRQAFHSFYTTKTAGTGLGMTLTKNIVEEVQGSIHCESQLGKGTTLILKFPLLAHA